MMLRPTAILSAALLMAAVSLSACQSVKQELGVGRNSPDEFSVVKRAPLTLPPDYELRAPSQGAAPPASVVSQQAKTILLGENAAQADQAGSAEVQLLQKMNAQNADPSIRDVITEENGYIALQNKTMADKLIFWSDKPVPEEKIPASVVNAKDEKQRIDQNQQQGKPVNEGEVPVIEKKKGTIDRLF